MHVVVFVKKKIYEVRFSTMWVSYQREKGHNSIHVVSHYIRH
jgi:hypothetical protein